jgi:hypothetical protein
MQQFKPGDLVSLKIADRWATTSVISYCEHYLKLNLVPNQPPSPETTVQLDLIEPEDLAVIAPPF